MLKFVVTEKDLSLNVMTETTGTGMVATVHVKFKKDGVVMEVVLFEQVLVLLSFLTEHSLILLLL